MKKYFYIDKKKQIAMVADSKLEIDKTIFEEVVKTITEEQWQQIDNAEKSFIKNGKFEIRPRNEIINKINIIFDEIKIIKDKLK